MIYSVTTFKFGDRILQSTPLEESESNKTTEEVPPTIDSFISHIEKNSAAKFQNQKINHDSKSQTVQLIEPNQFFLRKKRKKNQNGVVLIRKIPIYQKSGTNSSKLDANGSNSNKGKSISSNFENHLDLIQENKENDDYGNNKIDIKKVIQFTQPENVPLISSKESKTEIKEKLGDKLEPTPSVILQISRMNQMKNPIKDKGTNTWQEFDHENTRNSNFENKSQNFRRKYKDPIISNTESSKLPTIRILGESGLNGGKFISNNSRLLNIRRIKSNKKDSTAFSNFNIGSKVQTQNLNDAAHEAIPIAQKLVSNNQNRFIYINNLRNQSNGDNPHKNQVNKNERNKPKEILRLSNSDQRSDSTLESVLNGSSRTDFLESNRNGKKVPTLTNGRLKHARMFDKTYDDNIKNAILSSTQSIIEKEKQELENTGNFIYLCI